MTDKTQFLSPEQLAKNRKEFLQILRDNVKRDGVEDLEQQASDFIEKIKDGYFEKRREEVK